jgi:ATP synthase protein I
VIIDALKAEVVKILIIVILLWVTFTVYEEKVPIAIVLGIAIAAIFSGIAISRQETK